MSGSAVRLSKPRGSRRLSFTYRTRGQQPGRHRAVRIADDAFVNLDLIAAAHLGRNAARTSRRRHRCRCPESTRPDSPRPTRTRPAAAVADDDVQPGAAGGIGGRQFVAAEILDRPRRRAAGPISTWTLVDANPRRLRRRESASSGRPRPSAPAAARRRRARRDSDSACAA